MHGITHRIDVLSALARALRFRQRQTSVCEPAAFGQPLIESREGSEGCLSLFGDGADGLAGRHEGHRIEHPVA